MSARIVPVLVVALLGLAVAPWVIASYSADLLVPEVYAAERSGYETRVAESQQATRTAERQQPGTVNVVVLDAIDDPLAEEPVEDPSAQSPTPTFSSTPTATLPPTPEHEQATPIPRSTTAKPTLDTETSVTVRVIGTVTATLPYTVTARVIVEPEELATLTPVTTIDTKSAPTGTITATATLAIQPAVGMTAVEDVITEELLAAQLLRDAAQSGFRLADLSVDLTADGVTASGQVEVLPKLRQAAQVIAAFVIENESLVVEVTSIRLNNQDVTALYKGMVTSSVNSSLYKLLPQRFVKSFELKDEQVIVHSETKAP